MTFQIATQNMQAEQREREGGGVLNALHFVKQRQEGSVINSPGWGMPSPANSFSEEHDPISLTGLLLVGIASGSLARMLRSASFFSRQTDRGEKREREEGTRGMKGRKEGRGET